MDKETGAEKGRIYPKPHKVPVAYLRPELQSRLPSPGEPSFKYSAVPAWQPCQAILGAGRGEWREETGRVRSPPPSLPPWGTNLQEAQQEAGSQH